MIQPYTRSLEDLKSIINDMLSGFFIFFVLVTLYVTYNISAVQGFILTVLESALYSLFRKVDRMIIKQELERKIPEPPIGAPVTKPAELVKPLIALTADGSEVYVGKDSA